MTLLGLLLAQVALLAWLGSDRMRENAHAVPLLLDTNGYVVDSIRIEDAEDNGAQLERSDGGWILPRLRGLPADGERVAALLETLTLADPGWAIAHSSAARQRFQVASYRFQRRITLGAQGRELGAVFLGTSPGFRKLYARSAGEDEIYSIFLNRHELPTRDDAWIKPDLLQVKAPLRISSDGYSLQRDSGAWLLGSGDMPDSEHLQALIQALKSLEIKGIAAGEVDEEPDPSGADLILRIEALRGEFTLEFYRRGDTHYLRSSQLPFLFTIPAYDYDRITGLDRLLLEGAN